METIFINTENSKTNEPNKFVVKLSQMLDLKTGCSSKFVYLLHVEQYKKTV